MQDRPQTPTSTTAPAAGATWRLAALLASLIASAAQAVTPAEPQLLSPDQAFVMSLAARTPVLRLNLRIAPGYYLYRDRITVDPSQPGVTLGPALLPRGEPKQDPLYGEVSVLRGDPVIEIPVQEGPATGALSLRVVSQGCADLGVCFPPQTRQLSVRWEGSGPSALSPLASLLAQDPVSAPASANASPVGASGALKAIGDAPQFLPPERAFRPRLSSDPDGVLRVGFDIAEGYYLYRSKFGVEPASIGSGLELGTIRMPPGIKKTDAYLGDVEVYYRVLDARVPVLRSSDAEVGVRVRYQGCADAGLCYPPEERIYSLRVTGPASGPGPGLGTLSETDRLARTVLEGSLWWVVASFFAAGLLLSFTPCVLPMLPILSSIIVGDELASTRGRGLALSSTYVLAMSMTYTVAGVAAGLFGQNLQALFQHPAVLVAFALVFVLLGVAMLGAYQLQLPARWQTQLSQLSQRRGGGRFGGVAVMGALSALIVGPCVAAPLAAALIVIGSSGDPLRGGIALFALSLGMGAPLVVFGAFGARLLPRAGAWMNLVKQLFAVMLFAVAIYLLSRVLPDAATLALWALLAVLGAGLLLRASYSAAGVRLAARGVAAGLIAYGAALGVGSVSGGDDPLRPLAALGERQGSRLAFQRVKSVDELERVLAEAAGEGRLVMLDYYADWCVSCKEMERETFTDERIRTALGDALLLQSDVTRYDEADQALLQRFGLYGPPAILFFAPDGTEQRDRRVIGFMDAAGFAQHLNGLVRS